jgi:hypothetical protein
VHEEERRPRFDRACDWARSAIADLGQALVGHEVLVAGARNGFLTLQVQGAQLEVAIAGVQRCGR